MGHRTSRRDFLKQTGLAGVGFWVGGAAALGDNSKGRSANDRINIACVGVGGKGSSDCDQAGNHGNIVAICDIDENHLGAKASKFPKAKKYFDFREMLTEMEKDIDAVVVSTPDHTHAPASIMAMKMKKHVYCQKPLTHSVYEARLMRETAKQYGVATQMGNQGTAEHSLRRAVEVVQAGVLGPVKEVHVWTNRPVWDQAPNYMARPRETPPVPKHVHWDLFIGPAPMRPYHPVYHPFGWRGWWDFGTGALGDMACHTANLPYMALKLGAPAVIEAEAKDVNPETCPTLARVKYQFPARDGMPGVTFFWYEGREGGRHNKEGKRMLPPEELRSKVLRSGEKLADSASILVGEKGILYSPSDYGGSYRLIGAGVEDAAKSVAESLPRNGKGDNGMKEEWVRAIRTSDPKVAMSNFDYAATLTEAILLGNVAIRVGKKFEYDGYTGKAKNCPEAEQYIKREYRQGWTL